MYLISCRPQNFKELYNLRHASARNVVERIFGVINHRWTILTRAPHYDMQVQAKIPSALVALHNFILAHDDTDLDRWLEPDMRDDLPGRYRDQEIDFGRLATSNVVSSVEKRRAENARDQLAQEMWRDYQDYLAAREAERMDIDHDNYGDIEPAGLD